MAAEQEASDTTHGKLPLFGNLVQEIERIIDQDDTVRLSLRQQVIKRRGMMRKRSSRMSKKMSVAGPLLKRGSNGYIGGGRRFSGIGLKLWQLALNRPAEGTKVEGGDKRSSARGDKRTSARGSKRPSFQEGEVNPRTRRSASFLSSLGLVPAKHVAAPTTTSSSTTTNGNNTGTALYSGSLEV